MAASEPQPGGVNSQILFGQSACFSGPNRELGCQYHAGIRAAFDEQNRTEKARGGHRLEIFALDDGYETAAAAANAKRLADREDLLSVIGAVGTPTSRRLVPILRDAGVPMIGFYTGADFLFNFERFPNVVNLRASYEDETELLVDHMFRVMGKRRFGVIYQEDAFGRSVLGNVKTALNRRGLYILAKSSYTRNTHAFHSALFTLSPADLDALIVVGSYAVNSELINLVSSLDRDYVIGNVSFVNSSELIRRVDVMRDKVLVTEVVPDPRDTSLEIVRRFRFALNAATTPLPDTCPLAEPSATSLEGYILGRFIIAVLERMRNGEALTRESFLAEALSGEPFDLDDWRVQFAQGSNSGSQYLRLINLLQYAEFGQAGTSDHSTQGSPDREES